MSPKVARMTPGIRARAMARSRSVEEVTQTGHPGTGEHLYFRRKKLSYAKTHDGMGMAPTELHQPQGLMGVPPDLFHQGM